jgi:hypothetical protein
MTMFLEDIKTILDNYFGMTSVFAHNKLIYYSPANKELFRLSLYNNNSGWHLGGIEHTISGQALYDLLEKYK